MASAATKKPKLRGGSLNGRQITSTLPVSPAADASTLRTVDKKGRIVLGGKFANKAVIVERVSDTEVLVKLARVIPESEAWLYENATALKSVRKGLKQARSGQLASGPNLESDGEFAAKLED